MSAKEYLLMPMFGCGSMDLSMLDSVGYDFDEIIDQLDGEPIQDVGFNGLMIAVVDVGRETGFYLGSSGWQQVLLIGAQSSTPCLPPPEHGSLMKMSSVRSADSTWSRRWKDRKNLIHLLNEYDRVFRDVDDVIGWYKDAPAH